MKHYGDITGDCPAYKVYKYTFPDGKVYVGVTKNSISTRRDQGYQHNKRLQDAIHEVGFKSVTVTILADGLTQNKAFELEEYYIGILQSNDAEKGFNVSFGGKSTFKGLHHSEEHKAYLSDLYKGKVFTPDHIAHLCESHKAERKPVIRMMLDGRTTYYKSLSDAALNASGFKSNISRACQNGKPYKESYWFFVDEGGDAR